MPALFPPTALSMHVRVAGNVVGMGRDVFERGRRAARRGIRLARQARGVQPAVAAMVADAGSLRGRLAEGRARRTRAAGRAALGGRPPGGSLRSAAAFRRHHRQRRAGLAAGADRGAVAPHPRIRGPRRQPDPGDRPGRHTGTRGRRCARCSSTGTDNWPTTWPRTGWPPRTVWRRDRRRHRRRRDWSVRR